MNVDPPGLDLTRLAAYLEDQGLTRGPLTAELITGGKSNLTYVVRDATAEYVVRRPPLGHVLATAHDMGREYRVMTALRDTPVPVPRTYHLCTDPEVIGAPFYVMEHVAGERPPMTPALAHELIDVLAALHSIPPESVGLADFGRPDGYLERQVRRWKKQLDASRSRDIPGIDELFQRLSRDIPRSGAPAIVHGDFKLGNTLIAGGKVRAVLDWEMSTLGDPLTDLALFLLYGDEAIDLDSEEKGEMANPEEIVAHYAEATGRDVSRLGWYLGLACFKLAVIAEGIHFRYTQGLTVGEGFAEIGEHVGRLVARGLTEV
ncbi:phosphotransferase family protein [Thermobispora bispora]|uniref:phosphotransferase family protein n=1 Tax=Thermobispora bispora TaxID=2006 RepID=UPI0002D9A7BB|nr:phosphotransferase family protein [Thermobispora bispora]MBO2473525.1 phosphotransferase family protein [Actinomycetales bacterium]MBX6166567.1 phosphotransferase family protein [Thermobispora bispora]QSI49051.1 phosphotransferase family protein [Thermobispora bispora]